MGDKRKKHRAKIKESRPQYSQKTNQKLLAIVIYFPSLLIILCITLFQKIFRNIIIGFFECFDVNIELFLCNIHDDIDFLGTAVWTLTTILSAIVILYYSSLNYRNFGFTNRQIISYAFGSQTIPILVIYNTIIVLAMTIMYYTRYYTAFYLFSIYSVVIQLFLIFLCIYSTTRYKAYVTILKIEEECLIDYCDKIQKVKTDNYEDMSLVIENKKESLIFSLYSVIKWEENLSEKKDIIGKLLTSLFRFEYFTNIQWNEIYYECIYRYQQENFKILATYLSEEKDSYIRQEIFSIIYKNIRWISNINYLDITLVYVWYGALFNAFIGQKSIEKKWNMLTYIVDHFFYNDERKILTLELIFAIQFQISIGNFSLEEKKEVNNMIWNIKQMHAFNEINMKKTLNENNILFRNLILSWAGDTTEKRSNHYMIYNEIIKATIGEGRHDFIDYMIKLEEGA